MKPARRGGGRAPEPIREAARLGLRLRPHQADLLIQFRDLLADRAVPMGLIAEGDADRIWERHIVDSLAAATALRDSDRLALDLGSGAGLPGVVLAVAVPTCRFVLVDSRRRRAAFLEWVVERLRLENARVEAARADELGERRADVATARAFAPLPDAWAAAHPLLRPGGRLVYFAGRGLRDPVAAARAIDLPASPGGVSVSEVLDSGTVLVIMSRT